jgi:hypothetical protein
MVDWFGEDYLGTFEPARFDKQDKEEMNDLLVEFFPGG